MVAGSGAATAIIAGTPIACNNGVAIAEPPLPNNPLKKPMHKPIKAIPSSAYRN